MRVGCGCATCHTHARTYTHARIHARIHARTQERMHMHVYAHTYTHACVKLKSYILKRVDSSTIQQKNSSEIVRGLRHLLLQSGRSPWDGVRMTKLAQKLFSQNLHSPWSTCTARTDCTTLITSSSPPPPCPLVCQSVHASCSRLPLLADRGSKSTAGGGRNSSAPTAYAATPSTSTTCPRNACGATEVSTGLVTGCCIAARSTDRRMA